ncbi:hypothetical protein P8452_38059 [Trifolium repens]|nr:hypothetical protein P8452_38059 [Trifolium repens]
MSHEIELSSDKPQKKLKSVALPSTSVSSKALKAKVVESDAEDLVQEIPKVVKERQKLLKQRIWFKKSRQQREKG